MQRKLMMPCKRVNKITDIPIDFFKNNNFKYIIIDVDNTLIDLKGKPVDGIKEWTNEVKENGIKMCIASNSTKIKRVKKIAKYLEIPYVYGSMKPFLKGLKKAMKILNAKPSETVEIGDQVFTDVIGANRLNLYSILTTPFELEKNIFEKIKRKIEKRYLEKNKTYKSQEYYLQITKIRKLRKLIKKQNLEKQEILPKK